jgi:hypothetical protein
MKQKTLMILTLALLPTFAFAGKETDGVPGPSARSGAAEKIYDALNVDAKEDPNDNPGVGHAIKSVGGLECVRTQVIALGAKPTFKCSLDVEDQNAQEIYEALDVAEKNITPPRLLGVGTFQKKVATLSCTRSRPVVLHPVDSYSCQLN